MKGTSFALLLAAAFIAVGNAYPRTPSDAEEVLFVPLESRDSTGSVEVIDEADDMPGMGIFPSFGFSSILENFGGFMKRITDLFKNLPTEGLNGKKGNTTSTTKVVGNHVWTINDTVYENDDNTGVYHIQTIVVRPVEETIENSNPSETEGSENVAPPASEKPSESSENEISKEKIEDVEDVFQSNSDKNKRLTSPDFRNWQKPVYSRPYSYGNLDDYREFNDVNFEPNDEVDNSIDSVKPIDLSHDIAINNFVSNGEKGGMVMVDPDAELIEVENGKVIDPYFKLNDRFRPEIPRYFV